MELGKNRLGEITIVLCSVSCEAPRVTDFVLYIQHRTHVESRKPETTICRQDAF